MYIVYSNNLKEYFSKILHVMMKNKLKDNPGFSLLHAAKILEEESMYIATQAR